MKECFLVFHDWGEWQDHKTVELTKTESMLPYRIETYTEGYMLVQMRRCKKCKKVQLSNIKTKD